MSLTPFPLPKTRSTCKKALFCCYAGKTPLLVWQSCKTYPATRTHLDLVFGGGFFSMKTLVDLIKRRIVGDTFFFGSSPKYVEKSLEPGEVFHVTNWLIQRVFVSQFEDVRCSVKENS